MTTMIVLRFIHVLSGIFWAGSVFFVAGFLIPGLRASGPAGGQVMQQVIGKRRYPAAVGTAGLLTILSGAGMYWRNISLSSGGWATSVPGLTYGFGAIAAIVAIIIFARIIGPTGEQLLQLAGSIQSSGAPPSAEQASRLTHLQGRMAFASRLGASFLAITVICMATARYL
jgi:uncharacterized membrane protein